ncbi:MULTISPECIES: N-6 DNA methylase [unclassified Rhodococcus (in: high G+C Gram-positive bacteria)]|uniref:N-6 DNA methylase n=1 Tax=unclassified Rhodococcus (in: high G+C Gram-positive bacteria) TaxID=192944 RepID=UPI003140317B
MSSPALALAVTRLASRAKTRTEADVQADAYVVLTSGGLQLDTDEVVKLESQVGDGTRRRLDIEVGRCVIEVKKDLRVGGVRADAVDQLAGYVRDQSKKLGVRYVGILTDGTDWILYHLHDDLLVEVANLSLPERDPDPSSLTVWLESVLSTQDKIPPVPEEIEQRLGAESPAHLLDHATLADLYRESVHVPEVKLKRDLWAKLLRTAFGSDFNDDEELFINHTLLVLTAEIIAHAVVGYDITATGSLTPESIARGTEFKDAQINGVVEADFFDWVLEVDGGADFVAELTRRIARFNWAHVEHDVLKILYESVITQEARESLGEYYTPDWLADRVVDDIVTDPLASTVLDPSCGSGTFLFHAVRSYLNAADEAGTANGRAVRDVTRNVVGMDVHPVAVTLARVTYLLAIGRDRLTQSDRGEITVPVYLGDSLQWEQRKDLFGGVDTITISTTGDDLVDAEGGGVLFDEDLVFPRTVLKDAGRFDRLVTDMADQALNVDKHARDKHARGKYLKSNGQLIDPILKRYKIEGAEADVLRRTFATMRALHDSGRNHIWGYYVRNLIRPLWLAEPENRVDVLVGNPPWLRYSKMTASMQTRYKALASERQLLTGGLGASARDLSTLFVVRSVEMYLKEGGRFGFVMPHGTLTRKPHTGFRTGQWSSKTAGHLAAKFDVAWDMADATTGFPFPACVVRGVSSVEPGALKAPVRKWAGRLRRADVPWSVASKSITVSDSAVRIHTAGDVEVTSEYKARFRQGAILVPRALLFVDETSRNPLGTGAGRVKVTSRRSSQEKKPWKFVTSLTGVVERQFIKPVLLGESVVPFRQLTPLNAVLPLSDQKILEPGDIDLHPALSQWWSEVEDVWSANRVKSEKAALLDRFDFHGQLSAQLPTPPHRVVYSASGNWLAAARVEDPNAIIEHKLYWAAADSIDEARYLTAILNSETVLERVKPLQNLGLFGPRDFDKHVFSVPVPMFDPKVALHREIATLSARAETVAMAVPIDQSRSFQTNRGTIRAALEKDGVAAEIESAVAALIPPIVV